MRYGLEQVVRQAELGGAIFRRLRNFARKGERRQQRIDLREVIQETANFVRAEVRQQQIRLRLDVAPDLPGVMADPIQIEQVLLNLISNAIKYNRTGGKVVVGSSVNAKSWQISVSDTGHGIPDESLPNLFQKFYRVKGMETKVAGTGLGLSICKGIIQGHGGRIEVKSQVGVGTTFLAIIPRK